MAGAAWPAESDPPLVAEAVRAALSGRAAGVTMLPGLTVAWSGTAPAMSDQGICLVDGVIDGEEPVRWEPGLAPRLDGDFALAAWDARRRRGVLARDHAGARSLYWAARGRTLFFASELEQLLRLLPTRPGPDAESLVSWLASEPLPGDRTLYAGVRRLLPAHELELGTAPAPRRYWAPAYTSPPQAGRHETVERLRGEVDGLVRRSLSSNGSTGVLLSGGLDSTCIAAIGARARGGSVRGYTAAFPDFPELDESRLVRDFAAGLGLDGARIDAADAGLLNGGLAHISRWALPPVGWSDFWEQPLLGRAVSDGVTEMVSGDGGDEIFGLRAHLLADMLRRGRLLEVGRLVRRVPGARESASARELAQLVVEYGARGAAPYAVHRLGVRLGRGSTRPWLTAPSNTTLRMNADRWRWKRREGPLWWRFLAHLLTERVDALGVLDHMRRRLEWAGLGGRHPFLNRAAIELSLGLPPKLSYHPHLNRPLLREALDGWLPPAVRLRPDKSRFDNMVIANLARDMPAIRMLLDEPGAEVMAYTSRDGVADLLDGGPAGHPVGPFVWAQEVLRIVMVEVWLREQATQGYAVALSAEGYFSAPILPLRELRPAGGLAPFSALTTSGPAPTVRPDVPDGEPSWRRLTRRPTSPTTAHCKT